MRLASLLAVLAGGVLFGFGLSVSMMISPEVILSFLTFRDFGLMLVLGGAVLVTMLTYSLAPRVMRKPICEEAFGTHKSKLSRDTVVGAAVFGAGWGLCGVCPGPAIAGLGAGNWPLAFALIGIAAGAFVHGLVVGKVATPFVLDPTARRFT